MAHWRFNRAGVDRVIDVIIFKTDFSPSAFDRPVTGHVKDQIRSKLSIAGVGTLTVVFKRGPRGELVLHFDGPEEEITKAKAVLNTNRETQIAPPNGRRD
jgi:hypothetical protein